MHMPPLETTRLVVRPFVLDDLQAIHQILDIELRDADFGSEGAKALSERADWLQWSILNYEQLARLYQPPYGDRAVVRKDTGELLGACGFVPCLSAFGLLPEFAPPGASPPSPLNTPEFGLYYALAPRHQRQGYATEAATALIAYAFEQLHLARVVATTTYENAASIGVMRKLGMRILRNPYPDPPWLQVVGVLENKSPATIPSGQ